MDLTEISEETKIEDSEDRDRWRRVGVASEFLIGLKKPGRRRRSTAVYFAM